MLPAWMHYDCFFDSKEANSYEVSNFTNFQLLKYEDQVKVKEKIGMLLGKRKNKLIQMKLKYFTSSRM
jgi:hypothetical protein